MNTFQVLIAIWAALIPMRAAAVAPAEKSSDLHLFTAVTKAGKRFGYIDHQGRIVIPAQFKEASVFRNGRASVMIGSLWGCIDEKGKLVVPAKYEQLLWFSEGVAAAKSMRNNRSYYEYVDQYGKPVISARPGSGAGEFSDGLAFVDSIGSFIDKNGNVAVRLRKSWEDWSAFTNYLAPVRINGKWGFINNRGRLVISAQFDPAITYRLIGVDVGDGEGIDPIVFSEKLAAVSVGKKAGFIDWTGKFVIEPRFSAALPFAEGLAPVSMNGKWGYIDRSGKTVIAPQFDFASRFQEGLASVRINGRAGCIDRNGVFVIKPVYSGVGEFRAGLAEATLADDVRIYINNQGVKVWNSPDWK